MTLSRLLAVIAFTGAAAPAFAQNVRFAVIGDYGTDDAAQLKISNVLKAYNPTFVTGVGDNTYFTSGSIGVGSDPTLVGATGVTGPADFTNWDRTQGKYYAQWIELPSIAKGSSADSAYLAQGAVTNNFYPLQGNHDFDEGIASFKDYFKNTPAAATENYYKFTRGDVEFFMLSSDPREDKIGGGGRAIGSAQYNWAKANILASTAKFQVVQFHHPSYTYNSGNGVNTTMRWEYKDWGVDAVFAGHDHNMQAIDVNGLPHFVMGSSGNPSLHAINGPPQGATGLYGNNVAMGFAMVETTDTDMTVTFINENGATLYQQVILAPVPEPGSYLLLSAIALAGFAVVRRYRRTAESTPVAACC